jgi:peptidyl-dipeptidase Dcp
MKAKGERGMRRALLLLAACTMLDAFSAAADRPHTEFGPSNPFYAESSLPFHAPPFDKIKDTDYLPAIEAGIAAKLAEVRAIAANTAAPTFENTFVPLQSSGRLIDRALQAFEGVTGANTNPYLQEVKTALAPQLAALKDGIFLDAKLFARIAAIHATRDSGGFDAEQKRLIEVTYDEFVLAGAGLSAPDKQRLEKLNSEESTLSDNFSKKLLAANIAGAYSTAARDALADLSEAQLAAAAQTAQGRQVQAYSVPLQNTTQQPLLGSLTVRATRQTIFDNSWNRTEHGDANDTRSIVSRLAQLRAQRASLLGFASHAAWQLKDQMAQTPQNALDFLNALVPLATARAAREAGDIQALIDTQHGGFTLEAWDWDFYAEQVRKAKYDIDDAQIKPYFEINNVLENGVFYAANQLYGITFKERKDIPVYQADVRVFDVIDAGGKPLALFYCDYFKRDNKNGGAWMANFVDQSKLLGTRPVIYNVGNLPKPAPGQPALISFRDVVTMFHEFGHALHGMFADTRYPSLSGTATARDFVEFPSQFNEHWASFPAIFEHYARHYQTGAVMPPELAAKIERAKNFNKGYDMTELLAAAELDLQWHMLAAGAPLQDPDRFEQTALDQAHVALRAVPPRYRSSYFQHIWGGGYSAGYYAYLWTEMLADDAFQWFDENGGLTRANGDRFRQMILSRGNTEDLAALYATWRGRPPKVDAMLKERGLVEP